MRGECGSNIHSGRRRLICAQGGETSEMNLSNPLQPGISNDAGAEFQSPQGNIRNPVFKSLSVGNLGKRHALLPGRTPAKIPFL